MIDDATGNVLQIAGGTITNVYPLVRGMYNKRDDDISAFGWNNQFTWNGIKFDADVNYSRAKRNEINLENNTQLVPAPVYDTVKLDFRSNDFSQMNTLLSYADPSKLFLRNSIYGSGYGPTNETLGQFVRDLFEVARTSPAFDPTRGSTTQITPAPKGRA